MGSQVAEAGGQLMAIRQWPDMKRNKSRLLLFHQPLLHFAKWSLRLIHQLGAVSQYTIAGHGQALQVGDPNCQWPVVAHSGPGQGGSQMASAALHSCAMHDESGLGRCVQGHGNIGNPASYTNLPLSSRACIRADSSCHALSLQFQCPPGKHRPAGFAMQNLCCQGEAPQIYNLHQLKYLKLR